MSDESIPAFVMPKRKNRKRASPIRRQVGNTEKQPAEKENGSPRRRRNPISWPQRALRFSPKLPKGRALLVPSLSPLARPLGAAFEYVVRAQLQRINPMAVTGRWLAEEALDFGKARLIEHGYLSAESDDFIEGMSGPMRYYLPAKEPQKVLTELYKFLAQAKELHSRFIDDGVLSTDLLESYLTLARWHGRFVGGEGFAVPYAWNQVDTKSVYELRAMFDLVKWEQFKSKKRCLLRPQFRFSSEEGRNEPDLVIDGMLVDLKTTDSPYLIRRDIDNLLRYFAHAELEGFTGRRKGGINKLVIYYARFGDSLVIDLKRDYPQEKIEKYLEWYRQKRMPEARIA